MKTTFRSIYPGYMLGDHKFQDNLLVIEDEAEAERLKKVRGYGSAFFVDETLSDKAPGTEASDSSVNAITTAANPVVPNTGKVLEVLGLNGTAGNGTVGGGTESSADADEQDAGGEAADADAASGDKPKTGKKK